MKDKMTHAGQMNHFFVLCWLMYTVSYIGRYNFSSAMADMIVREVISKSQGGLIATTYFFSYAVGQILSGLLGDRLNPHHMVGFGLLGAGCVNILMGVMNDWRIMLVLWLVNGMAMSLLWSPMLKFMADQLPMRRMQKAGVDLSTTTTVGTLLAYGCSALAVTVANWRWSFFAAGILILSVAVLWWLVIPKLLKRADRGEDPDAQLIKQEIGEEKQTCQTMSLRQLLLPSGFVFMSVAVLCQGALRDSITTWIPTYLTESFHLGASVSIVTSMVLPLICVVSIYIIFWIHRRFVKEEMTSNAILFGLATATVAILLLLKPGALLSVILLSLVVALMHGVSNMVTMQIPLYFTSMNRVSTSTGLLNAVIYAGSTLSAYGIGALTELGGWEMTQWIWGLLCAIGLVVFVIEKPIWVKYKKKYLE